MPSDDDGKRYIQEIRDLVVELSESPERESVASEIEVLQSIYGEDAVRLWHPQKEMENKRITGDTTIRYEVDLRFPSPYEEVQLRILVSLPQSYPSSSPPQLQLLSRYIGPFGADSNLFGSILRTYISVNGVEWSADSICVFDGLQNVLECCLSWYQDRLSQEKTGELQREVEDELDVEIGPETEELLSDKNEISIGGNSQYTPIPAGIEIYVAEPIVDRKSSFIGRACKISNPSEVPLVLSHLLLDRRISRAAHPIINAWRCQFDNVLHQDNDDDGETAAGGRLAHLLQILEVNNVLVVVTRHFGGVHLGPDRFKHINQAARNALELGGFLDAADARAHTGRKKRH